MTDMNMDRAVETYIKLRDAKDKIRDRHKDELKPVGDAMLKLEGWMQNQLLAAGGQNMKTPHGTAYLKDVESVTVKDWAATLEWIKENGEFDFLEARVSKSATRDFLESTGELPPGVAMTRTVVTQVRR